MNYMCAMTTKECKEAYLKEYPKADKKGKTEGKLSRYNVGSIIYDLGDILTDIANLGTDAWSGSLDNIKELAKKHNLNISKHIDKTEGWYGESNTIEKLMDAYENSKSVNAYNFFKDLYSLLDSYKSKAEQKGMAGEDTPAPAKRKAGRPKKVVVGEVAPKKRVGRPSKVVVGDDTDYLKTITKNANKGLTGVPEKKVKNVFRKKKGANTDLSRFQEAQTNPAANVLTNPDLMRLIGSFSKYDLKGADKKIDGLISEITDILDSNPNDFSLNDEGGMYAKLMGDKLEKCMSDAFGIFGSDKMAFFYPMPSSNVNYGKSSRALITEFAGKKMFKTINSDLLTNEKGLNGKMIKLVPATKIIKYLDCVLKYMKRKY